MAAPALPPGAQLLTWTSDATAWAGQGYGIPHVGFCPPGGTPGPVFGTDVYSIRSSLCTAAVHARRITLAQGGMITWYAWPMTGRVPPSSHYGIQSQEARREFTFTFTPYVPRHYELYFLAGGPLPFNAHQPQGPHDPLPASPVPPMPDTPEPSPLPISWTANAMRWRSETGTLHKMLCPPRPRSLNGIYGNETYSSDSAICVAALHDGRITEQGGPVVIAMAGPQSSFPSVTRNGVRSQSWGRWPTSYTFAGTFTAPPPTIPPTPVPISWAATAEQLRSMVGSEASFVCPPGDNPEPIWGGGNSTPFVGTSSICTAGVFAGAVTFPAGGAVRIRIVAPVGMYEVGDQNGVYTGLTFGGPERGAFVVVR